MSADDSVFFHKYFPLLAQGNRPYLWQTALFERLINDDWPDSVALPTGAGKTSILQVWVLALAWSSLAGLAVKIPRRLIWVVNRRVVVDQATDEAVAIAATLRDLQQQGDNGLIAGLKSYSQTGGLLAISTLRGERADNREWSNDPSTPAVVIGTVDMIGSRLLFRGYGDGRYFRPCHAGLLGVDALIVNDESHLTPAFARLLVAIRKLSPSARLNGKRFHTLLVSATERGLGEKPFEVQLDLDVRESERFRRVYEAEKRLRLHEATEKKAAEAKLIELALQESGARTVVFVERPEDAARMAETIEQTAGRERVALLTGTMRGWERDQLAKDSPAFRSFQEARQPSEAAWLVATSAGEVGVNISGERLVTMLTESDHLLQRLGRLNRFGDQDGEPHRVGEAHVVHVPAKNPKKDDLPAQSNTLNYLRGLPAVDGGHDVSCRSLHEHPPHADTRTTEPKTARLEDWVIDLWSQTTAGYAVVPQVEAWLHGQQDAEIPETAVAWREEVTFLAHPGVSQKDRDRAIELYRLLPHERLSEPSSRVQEKLLEIANTCGETRALFVSSDGETSVLTVAELANKKIDLGYGTVLLTPGCGGLARGMLRTEESAEGTVYDVADAAGTGESRRRYLAVFDGEGWLWRRLGRSGESEAGPDPRDSRAVAGMARKLGLRPPLVIGVPSEDSEQEGGTSRFLLFFAGLAKPKAQRVEIELGAHCRAVEQKAAELANRLVGAKLSESFAAAGHLHDRGKANELWQRAMGGNVTAPLAKTKGGGAPLLLAGFRHELASLADAPEDADDLTLYLVGSHHGWGRPYWEPKAYDRKQVHKSQGAAEAAIRRFAELQRLWGPWGLAYLDAVFKAADGLVSSAEGEGEGE
jgi:CRISPR-associated endonuclease/helicase Cas3